MRILLLLPSGGNKIILLAVKKLNKNTETFKTELEDKEIFSKMSDFTVENYWNWKSRRTIYTDWYTYSNVMKSPERRPSWLCGDSKKRKKLTNKFAQMSGLHGIKYLCPRRKIMQIFKLIFRTLFAVCLLLLIADLKMLVQESYGEESTYMTSVKKDMKAGQEADPDYFPTYPAITVCRKPPYKTDFNRSYMELVEYTFLSLGFPMVSFTPKEISMVSEIAKSAFDKSKLDNATLAFKDRLKTLERRFRDMKSKPTFNLTHFIIEHSINCSEFFSRCLAMVHPMDCCAIFQPIITSQGLCYTLKDSHIIKELSIDSSTERPFIMDLLSPPHPEKAVEEGFSVFLTDPLYSDSTFDADDAQMIVSGHSTTISVQLVKKQRTALHTPWHGLSKNCPVMPGDLTERFTGKMCGQFVTASVLKRTCNCSYLVMRGRPKGRMCEPSDVYHCLLTKLLKSNLSQFLEVCHEPCIVYKFQAAVTCMGVGSANISRVQILYDAHQFMYFQYRTTTFSSIFSKIGGSLALYIGASIITVVEISIFLMSWLWFRIRPSRVK